MQRKTEIIIIIIIVSMDFFWVNLECCCVARVCQPQLSFLVTIKIGLDWRLDWIMSVHDITINFQF